MARNPQAHEHRQVGRSNVQDDIAARARLDEKLDAALAATFPASDPFELIVDEGPHSRAGDALRAVDEDPNSRAIYASPPCFMHELDLSYLGLQPARGAGFGRATEAKVPDE
jgi:hypothetical protein